MLERRGKGVRLDATNPALDPHKPSQKPHLRAEGMPQSCLCSSGVWVGLHLAWVSGEADYLALGRVAEDIPALG